jgi:hypothetical protein
MRNNPHISLLIQSSRLEALKYICDNIFFTAKYPERVHIVIKTCLKDILKQFYHPQISVYENFTSLSDYTQNSDIIGLLDDIVLFSKGWDDILSLAYIKNPLHILFLKEKDICKYMYPFIPSKVHKILPKNAFYWENIGEFIRLIGEKTNSRDTYSVIKLTPEKLMLADKETNKNVLYKNLLNLENSKYSYKKNVLIVLVLLFFVIIFIKVKLPYKIMLFSLLMLITLFFIKIRKTTTTSFPYFNDDIFDKLLIDDNNNQVKKRDTNIPNVIYISNIDNNVMKNIEKHCKGYDIKIYDNDQIEEFLFNYYGDNAISIYRNYTFNSDKINFWKYCILYLYGGYYFNSETIFYINIDKIFYKKECTDWYAVLDIDNKCILNDIIATSPKNPIIKDIINKIYDSNYINLFNIIKDKCNGQIGIGDNFLKNKWNCILLQGKRTNAYENIVKLKDEIIFSTNSKKSILDKKYKSKKIVILIISGSTTDKSLSAIWEIEKNIWLNNLSNYPSNIDIFFLESDVNLPINTVKIIKNTVYCGIKESFIPGILIKTLLAIKYLPIYDFYIRTNLSTIVDGNELNKYLTPKNENKWFSTGPNFNGKTQKLVETNQKIMNILHKKMKEKGLLCNRFTTWFCEMGLIFSKPCANLLVKYLDNIPYIYEVNIPDDIMLGILIGKHHPNIDNHTYVWGNDFHKTDFHKTDFHNNIFFHRCKELQKSDHIDLATLILKNPIKSGSIPIVIIAWNCLTFIKNFVNQIKKLPNDIIIIDNNSKYPPLHIYYNELEKELKNRITIHRLKENYGHEVYLKRKYLLPKVYILSDPDLQLNPSMPTNISNILYDISNKHNKFKVGLSLDISDSDNFYQENNYYSGKNIKQWESQFWVKKIQDNDYILYDADIDTTFTLINWNHYNNNHFEGIRIAGNFTAKHLPWYKDFVKNNISDIEYNYMKNNYKSGTVIKMLN